MNKTNSLWVIVSVIGAVAILVLLFLIISLES